MTQKLASCWSRQSITHCEHEERYPRSGSDGDSANNPARHHDTHGVMTNPAKMRAVQKGVRRKTEIDLETD